MEDKKDATESGGLKWKDFERKVPAGVAAQIEVDTRPELDGTGGTPERRAKYKEEKKPTKGTKPTSGTKTPKEPETDEQFDERLQYMHRDTFLEHNS